jgi:predicted transcriptional regulator of viral defense system
MQLIELLAKIKSLNQVVFQTRDIVAFLHISTVTISRALARLAQQGHLLKLKHGLWAMPDKIEPFMLPECLTAPFPSYISLQSAMYYHGMIEQIPEIIYAITLARTKKYPTAIATVSAHHIDAKFYFGYSVFGKNNIKMATPEKALLDFLYLSPAKSLRFAALPELELPKNFNYRLCQKWINEVPSKHRRTLMMRKFAEIMTANSRCPPLSQGHSL